MRRSRDHFQPAPRYQLVRRLNHVGRENTVFRSHYQQGRHVERGQVGRLRPRRIAEQPRDDTQRHWWVHPPDGPEKECEIRVSFYEPVAQRPAQRVFGRMHVFQQRHHRRIANPACGIRQHQTRHSLRMRQREPQARYATHRLRYQRRPIDPQVVQQSLQVSGEGGRLRLTAGARRQPPTPVIEGHAAIFSLEYRNLPPPAEVASAPTVGKHQRRPFPVALVKHLRAVDVCVWHVAPPFPSSQSP